MAPQTRARTHECSSSLTTFFQNSNQWFRRLCCFFANLVYCFPQRNQPLIYKQLYVILSCRSAVSSAMSEKDLTPFQGISAADSYING